MRILLAVLLGILVAGCSRNKPTEVKSLQVHSSKETNNMCSQLKHIGDVCDEYHVVLFAYQNKGWRVKPAQTHVFATWVKSRDKQIMEQIDISWGPSDGDRVRASITAVPGKNKCITSTLREASDYNLAYWILKTDKNFFDAARQQRDNLKLYKAIDSNSRPDAVNCIHACSDVAGHLDTNAKFGISAGQAVANFYLKTSKAWPTDEKWIIESIKRTNNCRLPSSAHNPKGSGLGVPNFVLD